MTKRSSTFFGLIGLLTLIAPAFAEETHVFTVDELKKTYERHVNKLSEEIDISFYVEELGTGKVIYSHQADRRLIPASGIKLITAAMALDQLGPSWTTSTQVRAVGKRKGSKLEGDLVIRGEGDPYLVSERLWLLARETARSGIKDISGSVRVNDLYFDEDYGDLVTLGKGQPYAARLSATALNFNSVEIHVHPVEDAPGKAQVEFGPLPHNYGVISNEVKLVSGTRRSVQVESSGLRDGREVFRVFGEIGRNARPVVLYNSVEDPSSLVAHVFAAMLRKEGINLGKDYGGPSDSITGEKLAELESLPLLDLIRLANTYSNNFMAEQIFRIVGAHRLGAPASKQKASQIAQRYLSKFPECKDSLIPNGSGLSWEGRVSSLCFVKLLQASYKEFRGFADLMGSMPVGNGTGTLKGRFNGFGSWFDPWKVRAKTGTLWSKGAVTSLIGFVPSQKGDLFVFSVIMNHKVKGDGPISKMRQWEEQSISFLQKLDGTF